MKNKEDFLLQHQRLSTDGRTKKNSFHFNDISWEVDGQKVS